MIDELIRVVQDEAAKLLHKNIEDTMHANWAEMILGDPKCIDCLSYEPSRKTLSFGTDFSQGYSRFEAPFDLMEDLVCLDEGLFDDEHEKDALLVKAELEKLLEKIETRLEEYRK